MRKNFITRKIFCLILLLANFFSQAQNTPSEKNTYVFPGNDWEYNKNPSLQGWEAKKLMALTNFIIDSSKTTGMMVIQHGKVIFEYGDLQELSYIASARKSILAMLYGPYVENGKIDLNKTLAELNIDDIGGLLPVEKSATIKNIITSRSGVYHLPSYGGDWTNFKPNRGSVLPGSLYIYNNWDFNIAGYIFEKYAGIDIYDAIDSMLVQPLKFQDWKREAQHKEGDSTVSKYPAYPMWFSTRDMARIGYLMLRNGTWDNKQIISTNWVQLITSPVTLLKEINAYRKFPYSFPYGYGYMWWVWDAPYNTGSFEGAYSAEGAFGQFITILPKLDLVIAHKTKSEYGRQTNPAIYLQILNKLVAANTPGSFVVNTNSQKEKITEKHKKEVVKKYTGYYEDALAPQRFLLIALENDTLRRIQLRNNSSTPLIKISENLFRFDANSLLKFTDYRNGLYHSITMWDASGNLTGGSKRVQLIDSSAVDLNEFTGYYYSNELETNYHLEIKGGKLYLTDTPINHRSNVYPIAKDVFISQEQKLRFSRSGTSKKVIGFILETKGPKNIQFLKK
ncbi:MAG: serine hydrolase domain-containing protein [Chitinophagaceae bacterium]